MNLPASSLFLFIKKQKNKNKTKNKAKKKKKTQNQTSFDFDFLCQRCGVSAQSDMQIRTSTFHGVGVFPWAGLSSCSPPAGFLPVCSFALLIAFILASPPHLGIWPVMLGCTATLRLGRSVIGFFPAPTKCRLFLQHEDELRMSFLQRLEWCIFALAAKAHTNWKCCLLCI